MEVRRLAHGKKGLHQVLDAQPSAVEAGGVVGVLGAHADGPAFDLGDLLLVVVYVLRRVHDPGGDLRVILTAQSGEELGPVVVHGIYKGVPGDGGVHLPVAGGLDDLHGPAEAVHVLLPASVYVDIHVAAQVPDAVFHVAQAPDDEPPGLGIGDLLVPVQVGRALPEVGPHLVHEEVDPLSAVFDVEVHDGDALVVELPDGEVHVALVPGVLIQQAVDIVGDAHVGTAVVVEEGGGKLAEVPGLLFSE